MMFGMLPKIYILKKYYGNDFVPYIDDQLLFHKEAIDHI
jgi:hypothetical protein